MDLRILTYNTQLRSLGMAIGFPPSLNPTYTAVERAGVLAKRLQESDYDIVALNEVFDEDAREILSEGMRGRFPFQVSKADAFYTRVVLPEGTFEMRAPGIDPFLDNLISLEDSGLFLASRWPLATRPWPEPPPPPPPLPLALPDRLPIVSFAPYAGICAGLDCFAAKGVLHVRVVVANDLLIDIFATHSQADTVRAEENRVVRAKQVEHIWNVIKLRTGGLPFVRPAVLVGDINVEGGFLHDSPNNSEWQALFRRKTDAIAKNLQDQWGDVQCPGGATGLTDPGFSADVMYRPYRQRLDYAVANLGRMVNQHARIDYALGESPVGIVRRMFTSPVSYLSDHLPLALHLAEIHDYASPPTALVAPQGPIETDFHTDFDDGPRLSRSGEVHWYRYDLAGTYEFRLDSLHEDPDVYYEVYLGTDLSRPRPIYRNERVVDLGERFVLVAPFFIKVANRARDREFDFRFRSHRHVGRGPDDAIVLIPGVPCEEAFPPTPFSGEEPATPWADAETKWFRVEAPRVEIAGEIKMSVEVQLAEDAAPVSLLLVAMREPGVFELVHETPPEIGPHHIDWQSGPSVSFFVCVRRHAVTAFKVLVTAASNLSLLRGGREGLPRLVCEEETSGWGDDDMEFEISADDQLVRHVSNHELGDMGQDDMRELAQWIPPVVPYLRGVKVKVIEVDDISDNDVGEDVIPPFGELVTKPRWTQMWADGTGRVDGALSIDVDDGTYSFRCSIGRWDETV